MSTAIPSTVGTPQPSGMSITSPAQAFAQAQLQQQHLQAQIQQQHLQAQNIFRQKQLMAQKQQLFQQPQQLIQQQQQHQLLHQHQLLQQQQLIQQKMPAGRLSTSHPVTPINAQQASPAPSKVMGTPRNQSNGQAVLRLLQFAEQLSPGQEKAVDRLYWDSFIQDFFMDQSTMKMGLFNMETSEQKSYEVNQASQARYFHTQYMCGVISIQMTLEKTMEYILPGGIMNVECPRASLINRFENGSMVISTGHLWVQFSMTMEGIWKIGHLDFTFGGHEEYISRAKPTTKKKIPPTQQIIPESLVNKWGVPPRLFHLLQIADIAPRMGEIVFHSLVSGSTPRESLNTIAHDKQPVASPVVKTQTRPLQALRQTPNGFSPVSYQQQQTYPTNTINQQQPFAPQSPASRKRNPDAKSSPVSKKKNPTTPRK